MLKPIPTMFTIHGLWPQNNLPKPPPISICVIQRISIRCKPKVYLIYTLVFTIYILNEKNNTFILFFQIPPALRSQPSMELMAHFFGT